MQLFWMILIALVLALVLSLEWADEPVKTDEPAGKIVWLPDARNSEIDFKLEWHDDRPMVIWSERVRCTDSSDGCFRGGWFYVAD